MSYPLWPNHQPTYPIVFPTDPKYSGPGTWRIIHISALRADKENKIGWFRDQISMIISTFACSTCQKHASDFIKEYPIPFRPGYLFEWTVMFHNTVNARLGKQMIKTSQARQLYQISPGACSFGCESA